MRALQGGAEALELGREKHDSTAERLALLAQRVELGGEAVALCEILGLAGDPELRLLRLQSGCLRVEAGADPELGREQAAVLLGERHRDRAGRGEPQLDEHLAEWLRRPVLLDNRELELRGIEVALFDQDLAELSPDG